MPKVFASAARLQRLRPWQICITVSVAKEARQAACGEDERKRQKTRVRKCNKVQVWDCSLDGCPKERESVWANTHSPRALPAAADTECSRTPCGQSWRCRRRCGSTGCTRVGRHRYGRPPCCGTHLRIGKSSRGIKPQRTQLWLRMHYYLPCSA